MFHKEPDQEDSHFDICVKVQILKLNICATCSDTACGTNKINVALYLIKPFLYKNLR